MHSPRSSLTIVSQLYAVGFVYFAFIRYRRRRLSVVPRGRMMHFSLWIKLCFDAVYFSPIAFVWCDISLKLHTGKPMGPLNMYFHPLRQFQLIQLGRYVSRGCYAIKQIYHSVYVLLRYIVTLPYSARASWRYFFFLGCAGGTWLSLGDLLWTQWKSVWIHTSRWYYAGLYQQLNRDKFCYLMYVLLYFTPAQHRPRRP